MDYNKFFIDLLKQLVSIPSGPQNEKACAVFLTDFLRDELGMEAMLTPIEGKSCNVSAVLRGKEGCRAEKGRSLLLGGHLDTVAPADGWSVNPFELTVRGDLAYGLGAADMKGGLAAQITVLKRLIDRGADFNGRIELAALCDEERFSAGAKAYGAAWKKRLELGESIPDFAIFGEPHFDHIVVGAAGKMLLKLTVRGEAGHGANPETGVNAIDCMARFLNAVNDKYGALYRKGEAASHCVLGIESRYGGGLNIPVECVSLLNKQLYVNEKAETFIDDLQEIYEKSAKTGQLAIARENPCYPAYQLDSANEDLRRLCRLLHEKYGLLPELRVNQSVSDANILCCKPGIPTALFGPEGHNYHKPDEYIVLSTAYRYMDMLTDFIMIS